MDGMKKNVGGLDRKVRAVVGTVLVLAGALGYTGVLRLAVGPFPQALTSILAVLVGAALLLTAYSHTCPVNEKLGVNTYRR